MHRIFVSASADGFEISILNHICKLPTIPVYLFAACQSIWHVYLTPWAEEPTSCFSTCGIEVPVLYSASDGKNVPRVATTPQKQPVGSLETAAVLGIRVGDGAEFKNKLVGVMVYF